MNDKNVSMRKAQRSVYIRVILYSLISSITAYIHSSYFIAAGLTQPQIDSIYIMLSICGIIGVWMLAIQRRSIASFARIIIALALLLVVALAIINSTVTPALLIPALCVFLGLESPLFFIFDELLEHVTRDATTATTRSTYLVAQNSCWIIAPLIGFILIEHTANIGVTYIAGLLLALGLLSYSVYSASHIKQEQITTAEPNKPFNLYVLPALYSHLTLQLFYACMISIVPVYMHDTLSWSWTQTGVVIACALLAFPLIQIPLGKMLSRNHIESKLMPVALIITGLSIIAFISQQYSTHIILPMVAFFCTRVGAATVEVCNESYIFRHIDYTHRSTIALFRSLSPLSYLCVPLFWFIISFSSAELLILAMGGFLIISAFIITILFGFRNYMNRLEEN